MVSLVDEIHLILLRSNTVKADTHAYHNLILYTCNHKHACQQSALGDIISQLIMLGEVSHALRDKLERCWTPRCCSDVTRRHGVAPMLYKAMFNVTMLWEHDVRRRYLVAVLWEYDVQRRYVVAML